MLNVNVCVSVPFMWVCAPIRNTTRLHTVRLPKTHQQSATRQTNEVRHSQTRHSKGTLRTYQVWPSSKRQRGEEEEDQDKKRELDSGGMKRTGEAPVCLLCAGLFLPCVEFWQASPAAWIRQPALPWPGEEGWHAKPGEGGRGEGLRWLRGVAGQGERAGADWGL